MSTTTRKEYEVLCDEVWRHNRLYFQEMRPEITDEAYDALVLRLQAIEKEHPEWISETSPTRRIGEKPLDGFKDVAHEQPMLSLEKAFTKEELTSFCDRVMRLLETKEVAYSAELKMDGLAISVRYEKGKFVRAVTRGDGVVGSDVSANLKTIKSLPLRLAEEEVPEVFEVRGEVFLPKKAFEEMNKQRLELDLPLWANPRNAAAGSLKLLDPKEVAKRTELSVVFYGVVYPTPPVPKTQYELWDYFAKIGLPTLPAIVKQKDHAVLRVRTPDEIMRFANQVVKERSNLGFEIDGIVIKVDDLKAFDRLGTTGKHPRAAIAFKFSADQAWTTLREIVLQVGRTGVITPVAELEPVTLAGSTISRATLHNFEEVERKDIRPGDYVCIEKGGDVIPKVVSVDRHRREKDSKSWSPPTICPSCSTVLVKDPHEVAWRCPNSDGCFDQIARKLTHFISKDGLEIEHLGEKVMLQLVQKGFVKKFSDIFRLTHEQLGQLSGFKDKSISNLLSSIEKAKTTTLAKLILALGIRYVGAETASLVGGSAKKIQTLFSMTKEDFLALRGVGEKVASSLAAYFTDDKNQKEIYALIDLGLTLDNEQKVYDVHHPFYNKTVVLTGALESMSRHEAMKKIENFGGHFADTVSKKVDFLIVGSNPGSKVDKAKKLSIQLLDETAFVKLVT